MLLVFLILLFSFSEKPTFKGGAAPKQKEKVSSITNNSQAIKPHSFLLFQPKPSLLPITLPGRHTPQKLQQRKDKNTDLQITIYREKLEFIQVFSSPWYEQYYFPSETDEYGTIS
jgi:hypothetical protein